MADPLPDSASVARDLASLGVPCPGLPVLEPLPGDAGTRRYLRVRPDPGAPTSLMLMLVSSGGDADAGSGIGGELPYLNVQRFLQARGIPVPRITGWLPASSRLYHEDLGSLHLAAAAREGHAAVVYGRAVELLVCLQEACAAPDPACAAFSRRFDRAAVDRELAEFLDAGLGWGAGRPPAAAERAALARELDRLAAGFTALPVRFSHRDFHGDNILVRPDGSLALIDFQDAFLAPEAYDLASLLTDREAPALLGWEAVDVLVARFAEARGLDLEAFAAGFWTAALQRQLKVAGRFVNLARRGKEGYLRFLPHTWSVIARALPRAGAGPLREGLASLGCPV